MKKIDILTPAQVRHAKAVRPKESKAKLYKARFYDGRGLYLEVGEDGSKSCCLSGSLAAAVANAAAWASDRGTP